MMNKKSATLRSHTAALCALLAAATGTAAGQVLTGTAAYRYQDATALWRNTDVAAGLSIDSARPRGLAYLDLHHQEGDYRRVQEGGQQNELQFYTERYQPIGRYLQGYGRFQFDMGRTKDRAWSDEQFTYDAGPFLTGSSIPGKYDHQSFDFTAALGTVSFSGWRLGARLDYRVSDLSRLRDPRSRSQLADYKLTPSATYTTGGHTLGVSAYYRRRKEKIPNINTVQDDPNLAYYLMTGMESAEGTTGGYKGFNREWVRHCAGATVAYGWRQCTLHSLTTLRLGRDEEYVYETYKREPGRYYSYQYALETQNRLTTGSLLHQLDATAGFEQGYADEYRQQLMIDNDAATGYTTYSYATLITFKKRFQAERFHASLHYRLNATRQQTVTGYAGLRADFSSWRNKHLLPTSEQKMQGTDLTLEGGAALLPAGRLWVEGSAGYHDAQRADLLLADATTDYAVQVLTPDMDYYRANYWQGKLSVTYHFPLAVKGTHTLCFVRAYGNYLKTNNQLDRTTVGLSFGLFN